MPSELLGHVRLSRLGQGLMLVGWWHLVVFGVCDLLFRRGDRTSGHYLCLWAVDLVAAILILRPRMPRTSDGAPPLARLAVRVWLTFVILCFSSASLNTLTGFQVDWFKISWSLLGTFAFAMMAWIFHLAFLMLAVQMSLTGLLIAAYPDHAYLIFGVSWMIALNGLGAWLEFPRRSLKTIRPLALAADSRSF